MGNYRSPNLPYVTVDGYSTKIDNDTKVIMLNAGTVSPETLNKIDGTAYQVPTGKKAKIISAISQTGFTGGAADYVCYADDEDGTTNAVTLFTAVAFSVATPLLLISDSIPAGKYINKVTNTAGDDIAVWILEENA